MRRSLASRPNGVPAERTPTVCVVDPHVDGYQDWASLALAGGVRLHFVASAEAALRMAQAEHIDLWVVNTALPGLSGCDLCGILTSRPMRTAVYLVADSYSTATEQEAWRAKASLFGCKPAHSGWFAHWLQHRLNHLSPRATTSAMAVSP